MSTVLIVLILVALVAMFAKLRLKVAPVLVGLSVCAILVYFALTSMGYSPSALVALFK